MPVWWLELSRDYLRSLRRRNRRPNTEITYRSELYGFGDWLRNDGVNSLPEILSSHIERWQDDMYERHLAPTTRRVAATALRGFLKWGALQELPLSTPGLWLHVVTPQVPPSQPRPIPGPELALILRELGPAEPRDIRRLRTRALFLVIYSSGARISEALSLQRGSVTERTARIIQKGGRPHTLVVSAAAEQAINDYLGVRCDSCPAMFASLQSHKPNRPLRRKEAQQAWNRLSADLQIGYFASHQIRHSCATMMRRRRVDIAVIARHLGHRGLQTILGYSEVDMDERRQAVSLLDPQLEVPSPQRTVAMIDEAIAS